MAKKLKRRREPRPPRFRWKKSDITILLACLDYSLENKVDLDNTAISHIAKRAGKEVTPESIQQALRKEYREYGRSGGNDTFQHFLSEGSSFLDCYTDSDRDDIRQEIGRIELPQSRYWLRTIPLESPSRSRTLSSDCRQDSETSTLSIHGTPEFEGLGEYLNNVDDERTDEERVGRPQILGGLPRMMSDKLRTKCF